MCHTVDMPLHYHKHIHDWKKVNIHMIRYIHMGSVGTNGLGTQEVKRKQTLLVFWCFHEIC